jgi:UDP-N-acetylmuramate dehydrogenase
MEQLAHVPLAGLTTLGVGGPAKLLVRASSEAEVADALRAAQHDREPLLVLGGGSNLLLADAGWDGRVVHVALLGVQEAELSPSRVRVVAAAGEPWDLLVARCVGAGLAGIEALAGIPGSTGATPIQNVGAYGQEVSETVSAVRVWDRAQGSVRSLAPAECGFGYRTSALKGQDRLVVLSVAFDLERSPLGAPVVYAELARRLGVELGARAPLEEVRTAVLELRRGKGMVIDPGDPDSVSAGSFFTNPILDAADFAALERRAAAGPGGRDAPPRFPAGDGRVKTSAAWLIERAGFHRGYTRGNAALSSKHTLALVNRGGATADELVALAREIRDGVRAAFGVELVPEPTLVGVAL